MIEPVVEHQNYEELVARRQDYEDRVAERQNHEDDGNVFPLLHTFLIT